MQLLWQNPWGLAALAVLAVPLLIHLLGRGRAPEVRFAGLRYLAMRSRYSLRSLQLSEKTLWLLRSLVVGLAALWLAAPHLVPSPMQARAWLLVEPGRTADAAAALRLLAREWSLETAEIETRWLAEGFPLADSSPPEAPANLWQLIQEADATLAAGVPLGVLAAATADRLGPVRPVLARTVRWLGPEPGAPDLAPAALNVYLGAPAAAAGPAITAQAVLEAWQAQFGAQSVTRVAAADGAHWIIDVGGDGLTPALRRAAEAGATVFTDDWPRALGPADAETLGAVRRRVGRGVWLRGESWSRAPERVRADPEFPLRLWNTLAGASLAALPAATISPAQVEPAFGPALPQQRAGWPLRDGLGWLLLFALLLERLASARAERSRM